MRALAVVALIALAGAVWSCGGDSKPPPSPTTTAAKSPAATVAAAPTQASSTAAAGSVDEVTGIVGSVSNATRTILIDRLSGAQVTKITVDAATVLRTAGGDAITLSQVRPSHRIVASGHLNERQDALEATHVTVQDGVPGAQPGG